jgi:hypothetical protein
MAQREVAEVGSDSVDAEIVGPDEDEVKLVSVVAVGFRVGR